MLWIQMSDGTIIDDLVVDRIKCRRDVEAYMMVDGIILGKLSSWNKGEFYQFPLLHTTISRERLCWLFEHHAENDITDVFEAMDYVVHAEYVESDDMNRVIAEHQNMTKANPKCSTYLRRLTGINRKLVYISYAKIDGSRLMLRSERRHPRGKKQKYRIGVNKIDKHLYL